MFGSFPISEVFLFLLVLGLLIIGIRPLFGRSPKAKAVANIRFDLISPHTVAYQGRPFAPSDLILAKVQHEQCGLASKWRTLKWQSFRGK